MPYPDRYSNPERNVPYGRELHGPKFDISTWPEKHSAPPRSLHSNVFPDTWLAFILAGMDPDVFARCCVMSACLL
jgi:hypothetical protein